MDKLAKLTADIGRLWEIYSGAYFTGIRNTLVLAVVALLANRAAKDKGRICLFGKKHAVFPVRFNPTVLYVACTVLACCLIACLLLGSALFAYYCMFAAIAIELIGAVYYTFQLK